MMISGISGSAADFLQGFVTRQEPSAARQAAGEKSAEEAKQEPAKPNESEAGSPSVSAGSAPKNAQEEPLSEAEMRQIAELARTDREVRQHEQAHLAAAGGMAISGASFEYETGPDGKRYAVAGEVSIEVSEGSTPEETLQRARKIRAAALAPADPSAQDRRVAAMANQMEMSAMQEIARQRQAETRGGDTGGRSEEGVGAEKPSASEREGIRDYRQMAEGFGDLPAANDSRRLSVFA